MSFQNAWNFSELHAEEFLVSKLMEKDGFIADLEYRVKQLEQASNHNGTMIWKVLDLSRRMDDFRTG